MTNDLSSLNYAPQNYRSADVFGGNYPIQTPAGVVHSTAPPIPPRPTSMYQSPQTFSPYGNMGYGSSFGGGLYGMGMGMNSGFGYNSYGSGFRNNLGYGNPLDPETRFIQMAEESSRGAFQSIEQVVSTIGNIATMLDSTYFALTSSFRAVLGLAANFSQMRGFLAKFFSTFTIFRSIIWLYRKLLYMIGVSKTNPSTVIDLNEAFKSAEEKMHSSQDFFNGSAQQGSSGLPMVLFLAFIFSAPYLIMKIFGSLMNSVDQTQNNPATWKNPFDAVVMYNFNGENQSELSLKAGQQIKIAPREVQQMNRLLSTNWLLASSDGKTFGLVPVNYIKRLENNQIPPGETADVTMEPVLVSSSKPESVKDENTC